MAEDIAEINRFHFNKIASSYITKPWQRELIQQLTTFVLSNLSWIGVDFISPSSEFEALESLRTSSIKPVRFLDYACGPGTLTAIFLPYITEAVGIDISENMVSMYNTRFAEDSEAPTPNLAKLQPRAVVGNFCYPDTETSPSAYLTDPVYHNFDFAAVGFGCHHFDNLPLCTSRLVSRLNPDGGVFMIADFFDKRSLSSSSPPKHQTADGHHTHDTSHQAPSPPETDHRSSMYGMTHPHGFTKEYVEKLLTDAGLTEIKIKPFDDAFKVEWENKAGEVKVEEMIGFLAVGTRRKV